MGTAIDLLNLLSYLYLPVVCHAPFLQGVPVAIAECRYSSSTPVSHRPVS